MARLDHEETIRILLNGLTGCNVALVSRETGLHRHTIARFLRGDKKSYGPDAVETIGWFVWRTLNMHVLLAPGEE